LVSVVGFAVVVLDGADFTRVSVFTAVPPAGLADWLAAVPVPAPPAGAAFWFADVFWFVVPAELTLVLVLDGEVLPGEAVLL
jgi:hypothetical protein